MVKKRIETILDRMHELFGDYPTTELNYITPFQCLIAVMMSAQTTDKQVNKVTSTLFEDIRGPQDVLDMGLEEFGERIRTIGLWKGKARNIFKTAGLLITKSEEKNSKLSSGAKSECNEDGVEGSCEDGDSGDCHVASLHFAPRNDELYSREETYTSHGEVFERWGYMIPDTIEKMVELPGVGIKTAKVVLYVLYRQRRVAVDTHVHRVMNRLGVVKTKTPEQTSKLLETIIPDDYKDVAHHTIIYFGRYLCMARKPKCEECPLIAICPWYKENKNV